MYNECDHNIWQVLFQKLDNAEEIKCFFEISKDFEKKYKENIAFASVHMDTRK